MSQTADWQSRMLAFPYVATAKAAKPSLLPLRQNYEQLERNLSVIKTPLRIGTRSYEHGLGTHSVSRLRIDSPEPISHFTSWAGVDNNERTSG